MALSLFSRRAAARSLQSSSCVTVRSFSTPVNDTFAVPSTAPPPPEALSSNVLRDAVEAKSPRHDWTRDEIRELYNTPLMELAFQSVSPAFNHSFIQLFIHWPLINILMMRRAPSTAASTARRPSRCARS